MKVRIGMAGLGTIGTGVVHLIGNNAKVIKEKTGIEFQITAAADLEIARKADMLGPGVKQYRDAMELAAAPEVDILVELIGGVDFPKKLVHAALDNGKHVVTANKALLAREGDGIYEKAGERGLALGIEASVAGGIPIIKSIHEALVGNNIQEIRGIINGTTNYILTKMHEEKMPFAVALARAQELGFAEADPTLDVSGGDAAHKIAILAALAFNTRVAYKDVHAEGIEQLELQDVAWAAELGYTVKLVAVARDRGELGIEARVSPMLVPETEQLAGIRNEFNAVFLRCDYLGDAMFTGRGAGAFPTASAVVADIVDIGKKMRDHVKIASFFGARHERPLLGIGESVNRYYLRFSTADRPGILSKISGILGAKGISIASMIQKEEIPPRGVPVVMITHEAREQDVSEALREIDTLDCVMAPTVFMRAF